MRKYLIYILLIITGCKKSNNNDLKTNNLILLSVEELFNNEIKKQLFLNMMIKTE